MKYRRIKRLISKAYIWVSSINASIEMEKIYNGLGDIGHNTQIEYPCEMSLPSRVYIGEKSYICANSRLDVHGDGIIKVGSNCYFAYGVSLMSSEEILIGNNVLFASGVLIVDYNHGIRNDISEDYLHQPLDGEKIVIGDGCWIGEQAKILKGVTIGEKCVVGAGAVVTKSVPPYSVVVGNPARVVKRYNYARGIWERV